MLADKSDMRSRKEECEYSLYILCCDLIENRKQGLSCGEKLAR